MKISTVEQAESFLNLVGEQNYRGMLRALADGAEVWVFISPEDIEASELSVEEKVQCQSIWQIGLGYAGWIRVPEHRVIKMIVDSTIELGLSLLGYPIVSSNTSEEN